MKLLDCTLRDGGYYNAWCFSTELIEQYLFAMQAAGVDVVELGLRSLLNDGFKGPCAFTSDDFLAGLTIPDKLQVAVMVNASELLGEEPLEAVLKQLFPRGAADSCVGLVRVACHVHEFQEALKAVPWLKQRGYQVGVNLMQIADRSESEIIALAAAAEAEALDVLYFADSMGGLAPDEVIQIVQWLRQGWSGALGIHTHDNMGVALQNTLAASDAGVSWLDATVTGMGRGPGNARTEELVIEVAERCNQAINLVPLMALIRKYFKPMQFTHGWGTNPYYYLAGKYGIHPSYIQEMLADSRYDDEDVFSVIDYLRVEGGKKFNHGTLDAARHFYKGEAVGHWSPAALMQGREVLLLGTGPGVAEHRQPLEAYIRRCRPLVIALNTQEAVAADLIDLRIACHPLRLLADCEAHTRLPQPLITPVSMLPTEVRTSLKGKQLFDFGLVVQAETFAFDTSTCIVPTSLVIAYALAVVASGGAARVLMAGFDGYGEDDPRNREMNQLLRLYQSVPSAVPLCAVTPTRYEVDRKSIYGLKI